MSMRKRETAVVDKFCCFRVLKILKRETGLGLSFFILNNPILIVEIIKIMKINKLSVSLIC